MIKPLVIGKKKFESNLIQAPLAGISCAPFRELVWQFGGAAYCCTEMLSAHHIASGTDRSPRYQSRASNEKNLCWQLSGNNPDIVARAAAYAISQKADLLDLNCGCPQPKIRKKNCGSQLLTDEKKLAQLIQAMKQDPNVPVTIKVRIDANHQEFCDVTNAQMAEQAGADAIIVHGRHWTHDYTVPAQTEAIAAIVAAVNIPVIANGDITDHKSLNVVFEKTHCAGFMIARASVGQPWLFQQLIDSDFKTPSKKDRGELFLQHAKGLIDLEGEKIAMLQCRKFGKYYARLLENKVELIGKLHDVTLFSDLKTHIANFFV
ncbi:MAG: tRNA-dihydrouridine synthase family protein [Coxiellaceae bacterium]|nr:tRNA-dihydrouridine synthase family protein [Coxiellaceae bacterium]